MEDKRKYVQGVEGAHSLEPQKAHLTGEFVVVMKNGGHALLHWGSILATVISETVRQWDEILSFSDFKILFPATS